MIDAPVLVLNRNYQPVNVTNVRRALVMLYAGVARALDAEYQQFDFQSWAALSAQIDDSVGTVNQRIRTPRIVILQAYDRVPMGRIRFSRHNIFARDDHVCQYCGKPYPRTMLNLDHVIPRSRGGRTNWENIVTSCVKCNFKKGGRTPKEANMALSRLPKKPKWSELIHLPRMRVRYREWLPFLNPVDASYWNAELESD